MSFNLWVAGDPIQDTYLYGRYSSSGRFVVEDREYCSGGALNVLENIESILVLYPFDAISINDLMNLADPNRLQFPELVRLVDLDNNRTISFWDTIQSDLENVETFDSHPLTHSHSYPGGLILSDYNKGALNKPVRGLIDLIQPGKPKLKFLVADSRYRTLDHHFMRLAETKIWHATGDEYSWGWANEMGFDYIFRTDGPKTIMFGPVSTKDKQRWQTIEVPDTKVVDTCGAGDTFTAAIGAYLAVHHQRPIDMVLLREAGIFAIECCQEVIQKPRAAITTKRL